VRVCDRCRQFNAHARPVFLCFTDAESMPKLTDGKFYDLCTICYAELSKRLKDLMSSG